MIPLWAEDKSRYIYDPLYGAFHLPEFVWDVLTSPELQRLREIRLCNINSLCLTGGANINRYEHALGTCHLAYECVKSWPPLRPIEIEEQKSLLLAALLHDVAGAAFGHSVEYIESREGFRHGEAFEYVALGDRGSDYTYKSTLLEPVFFGMMGELGSRLKSKEAVKSIGELISGKGRHGALINGSMDLDNIDNVYRLSYHIGLVKSGENALKLAKLIWTENGKLTVKRNAVELIKEWHSLRKKLYLTLLLNPDEFSAKCMLSEAIELAKKRNFHLFWYDVDFELLKRLSEVSSEAMDIVTRLMKGDLYGCVQILSSGNISKYDLLTDVSCREVMEKELSVMIRRADGLPSQFKSALIAIHVILDVNKVERQVEVQTDGGETVVVGSQSRRLLVGVFLKNVDLNMNKIQRLPPITLQAIRKWVRDYFVVNLEDADLKDWELYSEVRSE